MTSLRLKYFNIHINRASDLIGLSGSLNRITGGRVDGLDLNRAAVVQAVAALDAYIHGIVLDLLVKMTLEGRGAQDAADPGRQEQGLSLPARKVYTLMDPSVSADEREVGIRSHFSARLRLNTYQKPDDIARVLSLVGFKKIWKTLYSQPEQARKNLADAVDRRNRIVHQCDADPMSPHVAKPLSDIDAKNHIEFIKDFVNRLDGMCAPRI